MEKKLLINKVKGTNSLVAFYKLKDEIVKALEGFKEKKGKGVT